MQQAVGRARELGSTLMGILVGKNTVKEPGQEYGLKCVGPG